MASMLALIGLFLLTLRISRAGAQSIGVCYGLNGNDLPSTQDVINLYNEKGIAKMRIYAPFPQVLNALRGNNIELIVDVANEDIEPLASDASAAARWVQDNVLRYVLDVQFKYIAVGNEVLPNFDNAKYIFPAMENLQNAIIAAGLQDQIKVSTATYTALLAVSSPPSQGSFGNDSKLFMKPIINFLVQNNAPLLVNIYPYFGYIGDQANVGLEYALFTSPGIVVQDGLLGYQNLFDAMLDAHYSALERESGSNVEIVVSETGWPSSGNPPAASLKNAGIYYNNVVNHVKGGVGTPKRPGRVIETYLFAMFDENEKPGAQTERHFGLFSPNQQPKYSINFN
ncbi:glucan endo-1,3-beta-glucosidase-like [Coffea eugenioides]|uniref:Glucan endo-1,3-beta-glucosidase-like n=1 Tax=Coffea arabica TaxID=13443 RepID=A0A6P6X319_COFAR|nr:glucan endo-1,3-beta-glucosidase-like [Coffea arabica]XP_027125168.1 glucan endo-1,3-beta-glucosidase-like [Coffea arabica]XP_027169913.1 glucan endo-1,3-beta-glucosidase-like [Coffea eugenioides]